MDGDRDDFAKKVSRRVERRARRRSTSSVWFGVSTFGIVGWSVSVPTLIGLALGVWLDAHVDTKQSWTVALLLGGLTLGCINAWYWVAEQQRIVEEGEAPEEEEPT